MNAGSDRPVKRRASKGVNDVSMYDVEAHVAEIYDRQEDYVDDVDLIRKLLGEEHAIRILEPFCGTGRILIPLAIDAHSAVGIDRARAMLDRARTKLTQLPLNVQNRVELILGDVLADEWPQGFDLVVLGGNCLYELATAEEQERCISQASNSLKPGGYIYLDNNHMEGPLAESWQRLDVDERAFPTGQCADGTVVRSWRQRIGFDIDRRLVTYRRRTTVSLPDGRDRTREYSIQCHPPSASEMKEWLEKYGFAVEKIFGDRSGAPYQESSNRAIFWAKKSERGVNHGIL